MSVWFWKREGGLWGRSCKWVVGDGEIWSGVEWLGEVIGRVGIGKR